MVLEFDIFGCPFYPDLHFQWFYKCCSCRFMSIPNLRCSISLWCD
uniref:Uncharacterized protein n=1 Tax=Rhizophora mucronata TaxID=61149 RepID=A0A2P2PTG9_RHIMU